MVFSFHAAGPVSPPPSVLFAPLPHFLSRSPVFRMFFHSPYAATPLFATLTKTAGVCINNSQIGTSPISTERNSRELSNGNNHRYSAYCLAPLPASVPQWAPLPHGRVRPRLRP